MCWLPWRGSTRPTKPTCPSGPRSRTCPCCPTTPNLAGLADLDHWAGPLTPGSYSSEDLLFWLVAKLPREVWDECRSTAERKARSLRYEDLCVLLLELALEKESDQHLNTYRPGGGGSGGHGKGYQGSRPGQGTTPKHAHARIMENVKELFWCDARDEQGHLQHAPDCKQRDCFVVQGKQQEKNTGPRRSCRIITGAPSRVPSVGSGSTTRMSATISNAYRRSLRVKILAKAQAKVEAKAKATTPARASRKDVDKGKTRVKVDEEEALTASQSRTTRTRTRTEAIPTLIQGRTPSPLEGSLVLPHAHRRRPRKNKGLSGSTKVVMTATLRREAVS